MPVVGDSYRRGPSFGPSVLARFTAFSVSPTLLLINIGLHRFVVAVDLSHPCEATMDKLNQLKKLSQDIQARCSRQLVFVEVVHTAGLYHRL